MVAGAAGRASSPSASSCSASTARRHRRWRRSATSVTLPLYVGPDPVAPIPRPIRRRRSIPTAATCSSPTSSNGWSTSNAAVAAGMGLAIDLTRGAGRAPGSTGCSCSGCSSAREQGDGAGGARGAAATTTPPAAAASRSCRRARRPTTPAAPAPATPSATTPTRASTTARTRRCSPPPATRRRSATASGSPSARRRPGAVRRRARRRRQGPDAGAGDAARAVAGDARLLDGQDADAGVRATTPSRDTRGFFTRYVSGRGAVPAIRIGGQPYGILPTTAFSRIRWLDPGSASRRPATRGSGVPARAARAAARGRCRLDRDERPATPMSARPGDAHQTLLDIVGLHPSSVEYYSRYAESLSELFNFANLWGFGPDFVQRAERARRCMPPPPACSAGSATPARAQPDILQHFFLQRRRARSRPSSTTGRCRRREPIRAYTTTNRNYIQWLIDAAEHVARRAAHRAGLQRQHHARRRCSISTCATR